MSEDAIPAATGYLVGQDADGRWLAVEINGLGGGLFCSQAAALRFAAFETDGRADAVRLCPQTLTLDLHARQTERPRAA